MFTQTASPSCVNAVHEAVLDITEAFTTQHGREQLSRMFHACDPLQSKDEWFFYYILTSQLASVFQYNNPSNPSDMGGPWTGRRACGVLEHLDPVLAWSYIVGGDDKHCINYNEIDYIESLKNEQNEERLWMYQRCTQLGLFMSTRDSVFFDGVDATRQQRWCSDVFQFNHTLTLPDCDGINLHFGGKSLSGSNIVFVNGNHDPWSVLSVPVNRIATDRSDDYASVISIGHEGGHCALLTSAAIDDPVDLIQARNFVSYSISKWLE